MPKEDALQRKRLRKTKAQLVDELEQLERRHSDDQFANTIAVLQEGFALYDADDRLVLFNEEYRRLHPQMDDILKPGMLFEDLVRTNIERGLNADAIGHEKKHIRERMERHRNPKGPILRTLTDGTIFTIKESRTPDGGVVVTETDVTERFRAEEDVRRLAAAIEGLSENFALYGADDRLIVCNEGYRRLNRRIAKATTPGTSFEEHLRAMVEKGLVPETAGREEEWIKERLERHRNPKGPFELLRQDGIWLLIHDQRMADGSTATISTDITERKQAEEALRESEERFRAVIEYSPGVIIIKDLKGSYFITNKMFCDWYRTDIRNIRGKTVYDFLTKENADHVTAKDRKVVETGEVVEEERQVTYPDGVTRDIFAQKFPIFGPDGNCVAIGTVINDITDRKRAEGALQESEERFRTVLDSLPSAILLKDLDGRYLIANKQFNNWFNPQGGEIIGKTSYDFVAKEIADKITAQDRAVVEKGVAIEREIDIPFADGTVHTTILHKFPLFDPDGTCIAVGGINTDISDRAHAQEALRQSEERLRGAIDSMQEGFALFDAEDRLVMVNNVYRRINPAAQEFLERGMRYEDLIRANMEKGRIVEAIGREEEFLRERMEHHRNPSDPILRQFSDGTWYLLKETRTPEGGTALTFFDITEQKKAEEALRESEALFRAVVNHSPTKIHIKDADGRYLLINKEAEKLFGVTDKEGRGRTSYDLFEKEVADAFMAHDRAVITSGEAIEKEEEFTLEDGVHTFLTVKFPIYDLGGVSAVGAIGTDITKLKQAEEALRESEERFRDVAESAGDWIWEMGPDLCFTFLSGRFYELFPVEPEKIIGKTRDEFVGATQDDEQWRKHLSTIANHESFRDFEYAVTVPSGHTRYIRISGKSIFDGDGKFKGYRGTGTDVTVAVEAEAAAAKAKADLFDAIESITAGFALFDSDDRLVLCNTRYRGLHPILAELAVPGVAFREIIEGAAKGGLYHDSMGPPDALLERRFDLHRDTPSSHEQHYSDGRWLRINEYPTHDGGTVLLWTDITEHKLLERQLAGSQRMEAIGRLTGGVAHDFNNLLTVVLGNLQLLERRVAGDPRLEKYVATASGAAQRGAELTARLLAFSRRQVLETSVFDVNDLVSGMDALLQGTLGETIQFKTILAENAWPVRADPTQLENALLNLAINARDAMPDGGKMTVETANVTLDDSYAGQNPGADPGDYVMVAVGDTGVGMPPEILDHVFEPFFTTKEVGKGTGLGLSMVYGFVKQSKGYIKAYSEPGHGSVIKLYLPSAEGDEKTLIAKPATGEATIGGDETILVVEDDSEVRETAVAVLEELGYRVVEAEDGPSALRVLDAHPDVGLLFTDVIMPGGMNGPELADEVRRRRPGMKVLYTSGYTEDGIVRNGMLEAGVTLLGKPFQKNEMAAKVRRVLDS